MNYLFGEFADKAVLADDAVSILEKAKAKRSKLAKTPIQEILRVFSACGKLWGSDGPYYKKALSQLPVELSFSEEMITFSLEMIPSMMSKEALEKIFKKFYLNLYFSS